MQEQKRKIIMKSLASAVKRLRGNKSQFMLGAEYDIPSSVISDIERNVKDPQLTTLFKLADAFGLTISQFMKELEKELPDNFSVSDK
ncbi:helix-turn-helix transcriptional regulator [bacterium]|nr:helix-turn-helix transcriptional regulator [bacterium]